MRRTKAVLFCFILVTQLYSNAAPTPEPQSNEGHVRDQPIYVGEHEKSKPETLRDSIILLILTAALTGFLIPYVLKRIDDRRAKDQKDIDDQKLGRQKVFEADLARQAKVIDAQVQLLENLAQHLWEYQLLAIAVSYYFLCGDKPVYQRALKKYDDEVADTLIKIRTEISKSIRLAPQTSYLELREFYYTQVLPLDQNLRTLITTNAGGNADLAGWLHFNKFAVEDLSQIVDNILNNLATALELKVKPTSGATHSILHGEAAP